MTRLVELWQCGQYVGKQDLGPRSLQRQVDSPLFTCLQIERLFGGPARVVCAENVAPRGEPCSLCPADTRAQDGSALIVLDLPANGAGCTGRGRGPDGDFGRFELERDPLFLAGGNIDIGRRSDILAGQHGLEAVATGSQQELR